MKPIIVMSQFAGKPGRLLLVVTSLLGVLLACDDTRAGISPENVIVVVNGDSQDSRTIANHYVELRNIPSINVVVLTDVPSELTIPLDQFKNRILLPLLEQVNARKLSAQAKVIAYSAGFPTSVKISEHTSRLTDTNQKKYQLPTASLTGLTYFYQFVLADSEKYLDWGANLYARGLFERHFVNPYFVAEKRKEFDEAIADRDAGRFEPAAEALEKLFEQSRTISPLAILAAEARMQSGDDESAARLIGQAVGTGWTSGTYLDESEVLSPLLESPQLAALRSKLDDYPTICQEPIAFTSSVGWTACGWPSASLQDGVPYLMSCMLAVVHPRGSTVEQAAQVLTIASGCDSTFPSGSFWFTYTRDDRTNPRFPHIGNALLWLKKAGYDAEIIHAPMPTAKTGPCVGLMLGIADIPLENRKWNFVPGAISENLTSLSAQFDTGAQTKITELLHAGAAMSCGPVFEPYNLPFKFPSPMMYGYYASGASAIEAFYLSVTSPYQLLIVGDPLAQPFARSPTDWIGVQTTPPESGKRSVQFSRRALPLGDRGMEARLVEIYLEGRLVRVTPAVSRIEMGLPEQLVGALEVRSVLVGGGSIQPRASHAEWLTLGDPSAQPEARWLAEEDAVQLLCSGASSIELMHHIESIGTVQGAEGQVDLVPPSLGSGPIRLRPIATVDGRRVPGQAIVIGKE